MMKIELVDLDFIDRIALTILSTKLSNVNTRDQMVNVVESAYNLATVALAVREKFKEDHSLEERKVNPSEMFQNFMDMATQTTEQIRGEVDTMIDSLIAAVEREIVAMGTMGEKGEEENEEKEKEDGIDDEAIDAQDVSSDDVIEDEVVVEEKVKKVVEKKKAKGKGKRGRPKKVLQVNKILNKKS